MFNGLHQIGTSQLSSKLNQLNGFKFIWKWISNGLNYEEIRLIEKTATNIHIPF